MSSAHLNAAIRALTKGQRLTFSLLLAERMVPNLELYASASGQPPGPPRGALEALWALALGERKSVGEQWGDKLDNHLDSLDGDNNLGALASRNATLAVRCCLDLALEDDAECALMVSRLSRDDVRQFLQAQQDETLALQIVEAVVAACAPHGVPVTLKMRTGWCADVRNAPAIALAAEILMPGVFGMAAAQHLWMGGAVGLMTLAVMTRATSRPKAPVPASFAGVARSRSVAKAGMAMPMSDHAASSVTVTGLAFRSAIWAFNASISACNRSASEVSGADETICGFGRDTLNPSVPVPSP